MKTDWNEVVESHCVWFSIPM